MEWLPSAERIAADRPGGTYEPGTPWRLVLHTTEGSSVDGVVQRYRETTNWPHLTIDPHRRRTVQHLPFTVAARALKRPAGTVATNGAHAVQVEMVGFAAQTATWRPEVVDWLGRALAPVLDGLGIARTAPAFGPDNRRPPRMSPPDWLRFAGVCGHQHVPNNDHWDPGDFPITRFLAATRGTAAPPQPTPVPTIEEDDMFLFRDARNGAIWLARGGRTDRIAQPSDVVALKDKAGVRDAGDLSAPTVDALTAAPAK